jgi:antitoxin component of RelBE/YafQ-DinJ toxin-antitoxin module
MTLLQIKIDDNLNKAIRKKAELYGVPASSLIRIVLVKSFLEVKNANEGNVFNAARDNKGKGIKIDDLIDAL